jgi:hypothetical protein
LVGLNKKENTGEFEQGDGATVSLAELLSIWPNAFEATTLLTTIA